MNQKVIGIVGGMGAEAGVDLYQKIQNVWSNKSAKDLPCLFINEEDIPDRTQALLYGGEDFVPHIVKKIKRLEVAGATNIAIACNTSHARFTEIQTQSRLPIFHMIDVTCGFIKQNIAKQKPIGILGTKATITCDLYGSRLKKMGFTVVPTNEIVCRLAYQGIMEIKKNKKINGAVLLKKAKDQLVDSGAEVIVMGCTEIPLVENFLIAEKQEEKIKLIDPTKILAEIMVAELLS